MDAEALRRGRVEGDELCEIPSIGPIPVSVARGLLGDAALKLVITKGVDVANVAHLGRGVSAAQRIAALWTSPYCTNQGCPHVVNIQHDHRQPWVQVHETVLGNIDRLCGACHYLKTHKGWALVVGKGRRPLVPPTDPRHPNHDRSNTPSDGSRAAGDADHQTSAATETGGAEAPQESCAVVSANQQPPARPTKTRRPDSTLFENAA